MDELIRYCLRELSFDGDLGSNVHRLRDFVRDFYALSTSSRSQTLDDPFYAFVWSLIVQQPTVRVGTKPANIDSEVYIAPQTSAKRKAKAKGEEHVATQAPELDVVPEAKIRPLDDLTREYGDNLRIAVDPQAIFAAITGSHIRSSKLSPMVYSALQIITRGREKGTTVVELGQQSKYDQKTCFYLVKQLVELDLVVKVRRGGVGTHFCIHKYFFDHNPSWKQIREEETLAEGLQSALQYLPQGQSEENEVDTSSLSLDFSPIDARHLSSLPLIRARVVKLLKASKNFMHVSNNMLLTLGFSHPTKSDRRFFQSRIRDLVREGVIEKVAVPHKKREGSAVKCFRLVTRDDAHNPDSEMLDDGIVVQPIDDEDKDEELDGVPGEFNKLKMNITIHKQIMDLLEESGITGMTLNELSAALCNFDKRTIELLLTRAEKYPPPPHLSDLGIADLMETSGRERRHRYLTVASYRLLVAKENLNHSADDLAEVNLANAGGFAVIEPAMFYDNESTLLRYYDAFKDEQLAEKGAKTRKHASKNPILADGTVKKGRPRKRQKGIGSDGVDVMLPKARRSRKRKRVEDDVIEDNLINSPIMRPNSTKRPRVVYDGEVNPPSPATAQVSNVDELGNEFVDKADTGASKTRRKCGRTVNEPPEKTASEETHTVPKKRGRPRKVQSGEVSYEKAAVLSSKKRGHTSQQATNTTSNDDAPSATPPKRSRIAKLIADSHLQDTLDERRMQEDSVEIERPLRDPPVIPIAAVIDNEPTARITDTPSAVSISNSELGSSAAAYIQKDLADGDEPLGRPSPARLDHPGIIGPAPIGDSSQTYEPDKLEYFEQMDHNSRDTSRNKSTESSPYPPIIGEVVAIPPTHFDYSTIAAESDQITSFELRGIPSLTAIRDTDLKSIPAISVDAELPPQRLSASVTPRVKTNVSQLRRENELYRVVEDLGGVVNVRTKEFTEAHMHLIETLARNGEPTSSLVGTRIDKRTLDITINKMESQGRLKVMKTSVISPTGMSRPTCVVYLPHLDQTKFDAFLEKLGRSLQPVPPQLEPVKKIHERLDYGAGTITVQNIHPFQIQQTGGFDSEGGTKPHADGADSLLQYDEKAMRELLLTERTTLGQLYGYIVSKALRARELHLQMVSVFEDKITSSNVVSYDHRIIHLSYFFNDVSISTYCAFVSVLGHSDELTKLLASPDGRQIRVSELPPSLHTLLQVGRSRARSRILELLEMLHKLGIIDPLQTSESSTPWISCVDNTRHPQAFEHAALEGWSSQTPLAAPKYWKLQNAAPLYVLSSAEVDSSPWRDIPIITTADCAAYWELLQELCTQEQREFLLPSDVAGGAPVVDIPKSFLRKSSWNPEYVLTLQQRQYLQKFINVATTGTPLDAEHHGTSVLSKLSWVTSAPVGVIEKFYRTEGGRLAHELERARLRRQLRPTDDGVKNSADGKAMLAKKAAEAKLQRANDWDELVRRIHPAPFKGAASIRIRAIRARFLQSASTHDVHKWENEVAEAVKEATLAAKKILQPTVKRATTSRAPPVAAVAHFPVTTNSPEHSVEHLISQQGPASPQLAPKTKRRSKQKKQPDGEGQSTIPIRRHRFQWTRDYEELARDAAAIIRARCRGHPKLDWSAFAQVFPAVPRNSVRQRLAHIRDIPGNATYMNRLEERWYDLWIQHRGSNLLPDDNPHSTSQFDLIKHVEFLRSHIDKNALRVGFANTLEKEIVTIPSTVDKIHSDWIVAGPALTYPTWDFVWNAIVEEGREKSMLRHAFTTTVDQMCIADELSDNICVAESALKMTLGTPNEHYDAEAASDLLRSVGEQHVAAATKNLLRRGVLSKLVRDPTRTKPGRSLKISEINQNALGGSIPWDTFQDAAALEEISVQQEHSWREWPLLASDGDIAALVQLVSDDKVEFKIDTSQAQAARRMLDWNSKKADDDQIETALSVRFFDMSCTNQQPSGTPVIFEPPPIFEPTEIKEHGSSHDRVLRCCRQLSDGIVDCTGCLQEEKLRLLAKLEEKDKGLALRILAAVELAGSRGIPKHELFNIAPPLDAIPIIRLLTDAPIPLLFWAGYASVNLFSSAHLEHWTVLVSDSPRTRIFPRRWFDIVGARISDVWEASLRAVVGTIIFRPGISQAELRWRLRSVYDRYEICDILRYLQEEDLLAMRCDPAESALIVGALDTEEERRVFWFVNQDKHWYQL